ncbi:hypothetical protein Pstu14405_04230 [Stutzerimonas stutzeri]|nr:hypothetical protein Pstu14405_04230 [Stutzerimonas stutzeri]
MENPIYPPEYKDFILVFPAESGVQPLYVVVSVPRAGLPQLGHGYHPAPKTEEITGIPGLQETRGKTPKQGSAGTRKRWIDAKGRINPTIKYTKSCCVGDTWMPEIRTDSLRA